MAYSQIANKFFYNRGEKETTEGTIRKEMEAITLLIMHELYVNTNFRRIAPITIATLLESCGYYINTLNVNKFKQILNKLKELEKIDFQEDLKEVKKNEIININTENLLLDSAYGYFQITDEEINKIKNSVTTKKNTMINTLMVYCYLKARIHKRTDITDTTSMTTYQSYEKIEEFTGVTKAEIYINTLEELDLITVKRDMQMKDTEGNIRNCANIYLVNSLVPEKDREEELADGFRTYKKYYSNYTFIKAKGSTKNKNLAINGLKGQIKKQENEGKDTTKLEKKLEKIEEAKAKKSDKSKSSRYWELYEQYEAGEVDYGEYKSISELGKGIKGSEKKKGKKSLEKPVEVSKDVTDSKREQLTKLMRSRQNGGDDYMLPKELDKNDKEYMTDEEIELAIRKDCGISRGNSGKKKGKYDDVEIPAIDEQRKRIVVGGF